MTLPSRNASTPVPLAEDFTYISTNRPLDRLQYLSIPSPPFLDMYYAVVHFILGFVGMTVSANIHIYSPRVSKGQNAVYWGQNGGGIVENNDLAAYCTSSSGIDIVILAFLYQFGNSHIASGTIGQSCYISLQGEPQNCDDLASAIATCRSNGVKIVLSLGGANGAYSLQSKSQAETIGQNLWDAYGNTAGSNNVPRPFGTNFVDGWDFDIESNAGNQYYQYMISALRSNFASDPNNTYRITGAPQCPIPEPNMGEIIAHAQFDYLWIQFYNNPSCSYPNSLNYKDWVSYISGTLSAHAEIFLGLPASPLAATGTDSGSQYYLSPNALASVINEFRNDPHFGGTMLWSAGFSDSNINGNCTYSQQAQEILLNGSPCSGNTNGSDKGNNGDDDNYVTLNSSTGNGTPVQQWAQVSPSRLPLSSRASTLRSYS